MFDDAGSSDAAADAAPAGVAVAELEVLRGRLAVMSGRGLSTAGRVDLLRAAEELKNALAGVQATLAVDFDVAVRAGHAAAGMAARRCGAGVATELGLARRESLTQARRHLGLAKILTSEMPHTMAALRAGVLSEWRATIIARETACLTLEHRRLVDAELCAGPAGVLGGGADRLHGWGDRQLAEETKTIAYRLDPHAVTKRAARAAEDRYVSFRPAPDTMVKVTAMLPVTDGVAVQAALLGAYQASRCSTGTGPGRDDRSKGQVMADTFVDRLTGRTPTATIGRDGRASTTWSRADTGTIDTQNADGSSAGPGGADVGGTPVDPPTGGGSGVKVVVNLLMTDDALFGASDEPAILDGYGVVPAPWARALIANALDEAAGIDGTTGAWIRRLYTAPGSGAFVAMESRTRHVPKGLRDLIRFRDQRCRIPWCDAAIAHIDHLERYADGGETSEANGAGLCAAHNLDRETPNYQHAPDPGNRRTRRRRRRRSRRHGFTIVTPTGHIYTSTAPAPPGSYD